MLSTNNSDIMRVATAFESQKELRTVDPEVADQTKLLGRDRFYDALAGRYGLAGNIFREADRMAQAAGADGDTALSGLDLTQRYDLSAMTVDDILALAEQLRGARQLTGEQADLMGYRLDNLSFSSDGAFSSSPVAEFARFMEGYGGSGNNRTVNLIRQQEEQLQYLVENDADPKAIAGSRAVLSQLRQMQVEEALFAQMDAARERKDDRSSGGFGPFGASTDLFSLPPSAVSLFAQAA
ncbi:MAG: hypothetical protein RIM72_08340 [Alphaproteobacteria bacterium]